jgi:hypothetical protein
MLGGGRYCNSTIGGGLKCFGTTSERGDNFKLTPHRYTANGVIMNTSNKFCVQDFNKKINCNNDKITGHDYFQLDFALNK